jgi:hypothetical protein
VPKDEAELPAIFNRIASEIRSQYLLQYYSSNEAANRNFRRIAVSTPQRPNCECARARAIIKRNNLLLTLSATCQAVGKSGFAPRIQLASNWIMESRSKPDRPRVGLAYPAAPRAALLMSVSCARSEENNIPIDAMGVCRSLIGGCYATGLSIERLEQMARAFRWRHTSRLSFSLLGLQSNAHMEKFLRKHLPVVRFEDLKIPFAAMVTDLQKGESIVFRDSGDLPFAIRASCCVPALYQPVQDRSGRLLIDGGIVKNLPISETRDLGADIVIAVDVNFDGARFLAGRERRWV